MIGGPIAIYRFRTSWQYCPAPDRSLQGIREMMLATAKNSLEAYASLSPSRRRCKAELAWSWSLSPRNTPFISYFGCSHLVEARGFYCFLSDSQQEWESQFLELQTILCARPGSSALSTDSSFLKTTKFVSIVLITTRSVKSRVSLATWFAKFV